MKFFLDSADINEISFFQKTGVLSGVTTNPSIIAASGRDFFDTIKEIAKAVSGSVSAEVVSQDYETMQKEAEKIAAIANNIAVKVPLTPAGLAVCRNLTGNGAHVNVTLCFSVPQALLAAAAGATFVSPFMGRYDDNGGNSTELIRNIAEAFRKDTSIATKVLAASIRNADHVTSAALAGADIVTVPPKIMHNLFDHHLTEKGLKSFTEDWAKTGQSIL